MRILLTTRGSAGHLGPLVPFARALDAAGHQVLVTAQRRFRDNVERLGLPYAPLADPADRAWQPLMAELPFLDFDRANERMVGDFFARIDTEAGLADLERLVARWQPDVILRDCWAFTGSLVGERVGVPVVRVALGLAEVEAWSIRLAAPALEPLRARLGLPPDPEGDRLREQPFLTQLPSELDGETAAGAPGIHRFSTPLADPASVPPLPSGWWPEVARDAPLILVSFGSVTGDAHMPFFPAVYRDTIAAVAPLGARVLVTLGGDRDVARLGPLPSNVHVEPWVDQDAVLPHAAALIGHGGHGTTLAALRHGVPQVVLPLFSTDQWANANAIARAGAGIAALEDTGRAGRGSLQLPSEQEIAAVAGGVAAVLDDPAHAAAARALAASLARLPSVDAAAPTTIAGIRRDAGGSARGPRARPRPRRAA